MAGGPGVRDACLVQGSCLCPARRERQPGVGHLGNGGLGSSCSSTTLSSCCSPAFESWRVKGAAGSAGELPVFWALPFPLPLMREASCLSVIRDFWAWILSKGLAGTPGCQRQAGQGAGVPKSLVGLCQSLLKVILMDVQYRTLCLEPSVPEELVKNPCVSNVGVQQRETASSQNQCRV